jgi:nitrous oxidase accessory protein NosD
MDRWLMTYSFKLARRIAGLESAFSTPVRIGLMLVALVTAAGCNSDESTGPAAAGTAADEDPAVQVATAASGTAQVTILPGQSIQAKVNAYPAGTQFLLKSGTYSKQTVRPKSGNSFIGEAGAVLDGGNTVEYAFNGTYQPYPTNVTIKGLIVQHYNTPAQQGAIQIGGSLKHPGDPGQGSRWVVEDCEIRYNAAAGVRVGHKSKVLRNNIHHNLQLGISGNGDSVLIESNELAYNNYTKKYKMDFAAGGAKLTLTRWLVVRGNHAHDNWGFGLWTDIQNWYALYENNLSEDNASAGIMHEISYDAVIRNNTARGNGFARDWLVGAGILVSASANVQVYGNTVTGNKQGIVAIQQNRVVNGVDYTKNLKNLYVHDNTVTITTTLGRSGIASGTGDAGVWNSRNNRFQHNTYYLAAAGDKPFTWQGGPASVPSWKSFGEDTDGQFYR